MAAQNVQTVKSGYVLVVGAPSADIKFGASSTAAGLVIGSVGLQPTAEMIETKDEEGNTVNVTHYNFGATATLQVKFKSTTKALAIAEAVAQNPGTKAAVINPASSNSWTQVGFSDASTGKLYMVESFSITSTQGAHVEASVTLRRWDSITDYTPAT